jgi:hypothetical protein
MSKKTKRNDNNIKYNHGLKNFHNQNSSRKIKMLLALAIHTLRHTSDISSENSGLQTLISCPKLSLFIAYTKMYLSLTQYLVADNEGDAVLLHVSASSERQELNNEVVVMKYKTTTYLKTAMATPHGLYFYSIGTLVVKVK